MATTLSRESRKRCYYDENSILGIASCLRVVWFVYFKRSRSALYDSFGKNMPTPKLSARDIAFQYQKHGFYCTQIYCHVQIL